VRRVAAAEGISVALKRILDAFMRIEDAFHRIVSSGVA
jgi:hypothetical protein